MLVWEAVALGMQKREQRRGVCMSLSSFRPWNSSLKTTLAHGRSETGETSRHDDLVPSSHVRCVLKFTLLLKVSFVWFHSCPWFLASAMCHFMLRWALCGCSVFPFDHSTVLLKILFRSHIDLAPYKQCRYCHPLTYNIWFLILLPGGLLAIITILESM